MPVIAIFGPTASGKSAVALELAELVGGEIVSCDAMQLYRGLADPHQPAVRGRPGARAAPSGRRCGSRATRARSPSTRSWRTPRRRRPPPRPRPDRLRRERPLPARGARRHAAAARRRRPASARRPSGCTTSAGRRGAHAHAGRRRRPGGGGGAPERPPPGRPRARAARESGHSLAAAESRLWSADTRHPTLVAGLDVPPAETARRIAARTAAMFAARRGRRGARGAGGAHVLDAPQSASTGSRTSPALLAGEIDRDEAIRRLETRTRRYAKRQRTWMRRLPDVRSRRCGPRPAGRGRRHRGVGVTRPTEHDAVREARDALVIVAAVAPVAAAAAVLLAVAAGDVEAWLRWLVGAARGRRAPARHARLRAAPRRPGRPPLPARPGRTPSAGSGSSRSRWAPAILLVAGLPTTWPIVIGFALVCALLGAVILLGAALDM